MSKSLYIAEKPSVAQEFAAALKKDFTKHDGYMEADDCVVTWCLGHLVTMSYPEAYDQKYKRWSLDTLPFLPKEFKYEVIGSSSKQFSVVRGLLTRPDITTIYICTDSGREGEYIYRLVDMMSGVKDKVRRRVWIDSQTEEEILRGIREAKDWSEYDHLSDSAYLRAKEDYLMGINFSRLLTLKFGSAVSSYLKRDRTVISVGRVMTCVLGMVVRREREIRDFKKTPFYRVIGTFALPDKKDLSFDGEWKSVKGSKYFESPLLYRENGFKEKKDAQGLIDHLSKDPPLTADIASVSRKKETKNPPLLYNLAELQNDCSRLFRISPDETLKIVQELYEKKLVTYPRTDARVLSGAVAKEIVKNIRGLKQFAPVAAYADEILENGLYKGLLKTRYVDDKQITDHYAIIPTGQGMNAIRGLSSLSERVYQLISRRFLSIFYPPAVYLKTSLEMVRKDEHFFANFRTLTEPGYLIVSDVNFGKDIANGNASLSKSRDAKDREDKDPEDEQTDMSDPEFIAMLASLKKGMKLDISKFMIKEGETTPPKRYTSGSMILAMENAGQLIEDESLREQIKGSGIGTSATRADILKKLVNNKYLSLNARTQVITPTLLGELIYEVVNVSMRQMLNPELTASWEKGLTYVAEGTVTSDEYMDKLENFVRTKTDQVKQIKDPYRISANFDKIAPYYKNMAKTTYYKKKSGRSKKTD